MGSATTSGGCLCLQSDVNRDYQYWVCGLQEREACVLIQTGSYYDCHVVPRSGRPNALGCATSRRPPT